MKRFLISLLMVLVVVAGVSVGAAVLFRSDYETLSSMQGGTAQDSVSDVLPVVSKEPTEWNATELPDLDSTQDQQPQTGTSAPSEPTAQPLSADLVRRAKEIVADMTLEEKLCQMLFLTPETLTSYTKVTQSGETTRAAIDKYPVGGVIYFSSNLVTVNQTTEMIENIQTYSRDRIGMELFIGVDEEGGSVARLADNLGTTSFDDMSVYGAEGDARKAYEIATAISADMKELGFNVDFAPVADVLTNEDNTVVKDRSFGSNADLVSDFVKNEVEGFVKSGVLCAPKHFPGHGSTGGDTHNGYASSDRTVQELQNVDLKPFRAAAAAGAPMIMVGHMTMTAIDEEHPASLSPAVVTGLLRNQLGYSGVIITDALDMSAITNYYTSGEAAVQAVQAGCDMLLCVSNLEGAIEGLTDAVANGVISRERIDESAIRIVAAKLQYGLAE